ncbi:MAG: DNA-formamidopyrimidine glycosylase [Hormoscilla sp.]
MPELPEVETVRQGLNQLTLDRVILGGEVLLARAIAHPISVSAFLDGLEGVAIAHWHRRGKYLLAELKKADSPGGWLGVHLRMTGQLLWVERREPLQKHGRVRLFFAGEKELRFVDQRTFGQLWWVPPGERPETIITGLQKLGPEPWAAEFSVTYMMGKLAKSRRPIKTMLLDQGFVAGIGNIYADEALFLSGIPPLKSCSSLSREQVEGLKRAIVQVLEAALDAGGTTFSNFLNVLGVNGNYGGVAWVYNRAGKPCRVCGTLIQRQKLAGRSTHFCPQCQK